MDTKTTLPISEARKKIFDIAEDVQKPNKYYTLTEKGRPKAVIMSAEEFESWLETLEVTKDFPDLEKDIAQVAKDIKTGAYKKYTSLEKLLAKGGYITTESSKHEGKAKIKSRGRTK